MSKLKIIGSSEYPLNSAGFLTPIMQKCNGKCFQVGDDKTATFLLDEARWNADDKSGVLFKPVTLSGSPYTIKGMSQRDKTQQVLQLPAYVLYFKRGILYPGDEAALSNLIAGHGGVQLVPIGGIAAKDYCLRLLPTSALLSLVPMILNKCEGLLTDTLKDRIEWYSSTGRYTVEVGDDPLWQLAELMGNLAFNSATAKLSIKHEALMLLLSSKAENIRVWLRTITGRWELDYVPDLWIDSAWGIYDRIEGMVRVARRARERQRPAASVISPLGAAEPIPIENPSGEEIDRLVGQKAGLPREIIRSTNRR